MTPISASSKRSWTYADYLLLPDDGKRYEVLEGVLYERLTPATIHQIVVSNLLAYLYGWVRQHKLGAVLISPIDVRFDSVDTVIQPDLLFLSNEQRSSISELAIECVPNLLVEVLSPSTVIYDRLKKFDVYEKVGVKEYWIVNPKTVSVEIYSLNRGGYILVGEYSGRETPNSPILGQLTFEAQELSLT